MSKKLLTIFSSLILLGILSISCSNADKTGSGDSGNGGSSGTGGSTVDTSKGIEQFNGNIYVSSSTITANNGEGYLWISIQNGKFTFVATPDNTTKPPFEELNFYDAKGTGNNYSFSDNTYATYEGTLKFSANASTVTIYFTKNSGDKTGAILNKDIVCNKK